MGSSIIKKKKTINFEQIDEEEADEVTLQRSEFDSPSVVKRERPIVGLSGPSLLPLSSDFGEGQLKSMLVNQQYINELRTGKIKRDVKNQARNPHLLIHNPSPKDQKKKDKKKKKQIGEVSSEFRFVAYPELVHNLLDDEGDEEERKEERKESEQQQLRSQMKK